MNLDPRFADSEILFNNFLVYGYPTGAFIYIQKYKDGKNVSVYNVGNITCSHKPIRTKKPVI